MHKYRLIAKKGEGTFSEVLKAQSVLTGEYFAVKCMKNHFKTIEQVNSLREIQALRRLNAHDNIIPLTEVLFDENSGRLALVFELMDMNVYEMIKNRKQYLKPERIQHLMLQLMKAVAHMHKNGIFHRDIKPENILVQGDRLKVADLGSCRGIYTKQPFTEYISTRWYRAPECLLTNGYYSKQMDLWGVGCVMFEIVSLFPLFPGTNELDQIDKIHKILGTPGPDLLNKFKTYTSHISNFNFTPTTGTGIATLLQHTTEDCRKLIETLVAYDPEDRGSAVDALRSDYFKNPRVRTASPKQRNKSKNKKLPRVVKKKPRQTNESDADEDAAHNAAPSAAQALADDALLDNRDNLLDSDDGDDGAKDLQDDSKDLNLAPLPQKTKKSKGKLRKAGFNSSATNLPTIMNTSIINSNSSQNNHNTSSMNHLSLNITGYNNKVSKSKSKHKNNSNFAVDSKPKKKNLPQGLQVAAMSYPSKKF